MFIREKIKIFVTRNRRCWTSIVIVNPKERLILKKNHNLTLIQAEIIAITESIRGIKEQINKKDNLEIITYSKIFSKINLKEENKKSKN